MSSKLTVHKQLDAPHVELSILSVVNQRFNLVPPVDVIEWRASAHIINPELRGRATVAFLDPKGSRTGNSPVSAILCFTEHECRGYQVKRGLHLEELDILVLSSSIVNVRETDFQRVPHRGFEVVRNLCWSFVWDWHELHRVVYECA